MLTTGNFMTEDISVTVTQDSGSNYKLSSLYENRVIVFKIMRRFGCPLMRNEAQEFSKRSKEFEKIGVTMVGLGFDTAGLTDFNSGNYWNGELFLDPSRVIYNYLGILRKNKVASVTGHLNKETRRSINDAKKDVSGNKKGDKQQLGGTFVINPSGKILYSFHQKNLTDSPDIDDILNVCKKYHSEVKTMNTLHTIFDANKKQAISA